MMRQRIAFGVAVTSAIWLTFAACSSDDSGGSPGNAADASSDQSSGPPACFQSSAIVTSPTSLAPAAHQGQCASDDLVSQYLSDCLMTAGADASPAACAAYLSANPTCALCLAGRIAADAGPAPASPWPALITVDSAGDAAPAVSVCVAAISSGTDTCKSNYASDNVCAESGCRACGANDYSACTTAETTDPASTCLTASPLDSACVAALDAVSQSDADTLCGADTTIASEADFARVFMLVGKTLCEN